MAGDRPRRTRDARDAAQQAFKAATTKPAEPLPKPLSLIGAKELVSLQIDRDVLDHFHQEGRPGWQDWKRTHGPNLAQVQSRRDLT